jgi:glutamate--cysteine ligase
MSRDSSCSLDYPRRFGSTTGGGHSGADDVTGLTREDLAQTFTARPDTRERVGVEVECGLVEPTTGRAIRYPEGRALLAAVRREFGGEPIHEAGHLVGVALPGGAQFTLELGGALEYSSAPADSLAEVVAATERAMLAVADLADRQDIAVLPTGLLPFTAVREIPWTPKPRIDIMRRYFRGLGAAGAFADGIMGLSLSVQTSLDYMSTADLLEKLRVLTVASPVAAALFVNSPLENGAATGVLSRRMQMWRSVDPSRCGVLGLAVAPDASVDRLLDWVLELPMIYRRTGDRYLPAPDRPFGGLIRGGFPDGGWPDPADWTSHLSQLWPQVRPRHTLEVRIPDGLGWPAFASAPAFWVGLAYHPDSRRAALALLDDLTGAELDRVTEEVAIRGLTAKAGARAVGELAERLLDLARAGLAARVAAGREPARVLDLLDPLHDVVRTGRTYAERTRHDWYGPFAQRPAAFVAATRI